MNTGIVFEQETPLVSPDQYRDVSRDPCTITDTNVTFTKVIPSGIYVPTYNGSTSISVVTHSTKLNVYSAISIMVWVNISTIQTSGVMSKRQAGGTVAGNYTFGLAENGTKLNFGVDDNNVLSSVVHGYSTSEWHLVGCCFTNGDNAIFFSDGVQLGTVVVQGSNLTPNTENLDIGGPGGLAAFAGMIAKLRIWNYIRSAEQFYADFQNERNLFGV